jgi:hypothetical protein
MTWIGYSNLMDLEMQKEGLDIANEENLDSYLMQNRLAHTAEHAFIGSLQKLLGKTLNVRKAREDTVTVIVLGITRFDCSSVARNFVRQCSC